MFKWKSMQEHEKNGWRLTNADYLSVAISVRSSKNSKSRDAVVVISSVNTERQYTATVKKNRRATAGEIYANRRRKTECNSTELELRLLKRIPMQYGNLISVKSAPLQMKNCILISVVLNVNVVLKLELFRRRILWNYSILTLILNSKSWRRQQNIN